MEDAPRGWSFIQLFGHNLIEPGRFVPRTEEQYAGAVAYLVSRCGMRAVLEHVGYLRKDRLVVPRLPDSIFHVDLYMYDVVRESTYMTRPLLIANNLEVGSTLANRDMWLMGKSRDLGTTISSLRILNTMIPS
jgi:hypothetical protein